MWFESDVKAWQDKIQSIPRSFAFADWFPKEGRIYLPFQPGSEKDIDDDIKQYFDKDHKYQIHDYAKGLVKDSTGRIVRLSKIINQDEKIELKRIQDLYNQKQLSDIKYNREMRSTQQYFNDLRKTFEASPLRRGVNAKSPYMVVISSTPEDIAAMSTNRDWKSCMDLSGGSNRSSIWCELENGGFVAYLCRTEDVNIDKPLARIHIRRFDNKKGQSIALPEETVYGNEIQGFREAVQAWLDSKQGKIRPGRYVRQGGWYSDTFGSADPDDSKRDQREAMKHTILPQTANGLFKLFDKLPPEKAVMKLRIVDKLLAKKLTDEQKKKLATIIRSDYKHRTDELFQKYPDLVTPEDYKNGTNYARTAILRAKKDDPQYKELHKELVTQSVMNLDINDPKLKINQPEMGSSTAASLELSDILRPLGEVGQLPEPLIRKTLQFADQMMERYKSQLTHQTRHTYSSPVLNVLSTLIHAFHMAHADTPSVIAFYTKLLPYWDNLGEEHGLGIAIGSLGENGKSFLPFLKDKREQTTDPLQQERLSYIIDSIENGTGRSDKYNFF